MEPGVGLVGGGRNDRRQLEELALIPGQLWPPLEGADPVGPDVLGAVDPVDPEVPVDELPDEPDVVEPELVVAALWMLDGEELAA